MLSDLIDDFTLQSLVEPPSEKKVWTLYGNRAPAQTSISESDRNVSENLATLLLSCQRLMLSSELERLTSQIEKKDIFEGSAALFELVYLPCLKHLVRKALQQRIALSASMFKQLFYVVLMTYAVNVVKPEPAHIKHWARPPVSCPCADCKDLNAFLTSPTAKKWNFKAAAKRRNHIESNLWGQDVQRRNEGRSPLTLVVTKTQAKYQAALKEWKGRRKVAENHLKEIGHSTLKDILGDQYQLVGMLKIDELLADIRARGLGVAPLGQSQDGPNRILPPITKRKVPNSNEIIVLDD